MNKIKIIIYLKVASSYLTNKNYSKLVESLVLNLNRLRVETKYLNEIKELLKKKKRELKSKESNINFLANLTFNKYFKNLFDDLFKDGF
jgi:hypothetical protein